MTRTDDQATTETLVREVLATLEPHDRVIGLSVLNYCMAALIHIRFDGAEGALRHSDEQTRYLLAEITKINSASIRLH